MHLISTTAKCWIFSWSKAESPHSRYFSFLFVLQMRNLLTNCKLFVNHSIPLTICCFCSFPTSHQGAFLPLFPTSHQGAVFALVSHKPPSCCFRPCFPQATPAVSICVNAVSSSHVSPSLLFYNLHFCHQFVYTVILLLFYSVH